MTPSTRHQVLRQVVELHASSAALASELHRELSREFVTRLGPVLDDVMSKACPDDVTLRVDRIELDVSAETVESLYDAISSAFRERLAPSLRAWAVASSAHADRGVRRLEKGEAAFERLITFLANGALPAGSERVTRETLEGDALDAALTRPAELRRALGEFRSPSIARRLARQFTLSTRVELAAVLFGIERESVLAFIAEGQKALQGPRPASALAMTRGELGGAVETLLYERLFLAALEHAARAGESGAEAFAAVGSRLKSELEAPGDATELENSPKRSARANQPVRSRLATEQSAPMEPHGTLHRQPPTTNREHLVTRQPDQTPAEESSSLVRHDRTLSETVGASNQSHSVRRAAAHAPAPEAPGARAARETSQPATRETLHEATSREAAPSDAPSPFVTPNAPRRDSGEPNRALESPFPGNEPLWVAHAGLVLLWPFLENYFAKIELVSERRFVSASSQERAVALAAHLVDGAETWGEHELLLEKILCGCPPFEAVTTRVEITEKERHEADALLASVVDYWSALGRTSVAGVRTAFLGREGWLSQGESGFKLEIPRVGYDVLLDKLPWGFGVVSLPWMERPIYVEW